MLESILDIKKNKKTRRINRKPPIKINKLDKNLSFDISNFLCYNIINKSKKGSLNLMTNSNLREAIRAAFHDSGLSVEDFDSAISSALDELRSEEKRATTCGLDCMSLPWESFFDNIIFPYITAQIPSCKDLANLSKDDELYKIIRSETKEFFASVGKVHSLLSNPNNDYLSELFSALLQ